MRDIETLISTLGAYMRKKLLANSHKPHWHDMKFGELLLGMHEEKWEFLEQLNSPTATVDSIWEEAADLCNYITMISDRAVRRKFEATENENQS